MALGGRVEGTVGFDEFCHRADQPVPFRQAKFSPVFMKGATIFKRPRIPSRYWQPCVIENGRLKETAPEDFGPDIFTDYLVDFIQRERDQPFLAYYPLNLVHDIAGGGLPTMPFRGRPGANKGGTLEDMFRYIDTTIGRLIEALEAAGLRENTLVIFTADNGDSKNGMKMHATENGPRVPLIINGPGLVKSRGSSRELVNSRIFTLIGLFGYSITEVPCPRW